MTTTTQLPMAVTEQIVVSPIVLTTEVIGIIVT